MASMLAGGGNSGHALPARRYRPPSAKDSPFATTGTQANFETYEINLSGKPVKVGNGHMDIQ
jgi:filamentous hemagglutinin